MTDLSVSSPPFPEPGLLSNGQYRVAVSVAGSGRSEWRSYALTRYTADLTRDAEGWFFYLRDLDSHQVWSAGHQPVQRSPLRYEARWEASCVTIEREDERIETRMEIRVDPLHDLEWRSVTLTNRGGTPRRLELTSYVEVALNTPAADAGHPAFSKLFLQTEFLPGLEALLVCRRPRSPEEPALALGHALRPEVPDGTAVEYETDRARFIGRGRTLVAPRALDPSIRLSGTVGSVLDPILSLRRTIELAAGASARFDAVLAAGLDRQQVKQLLSDATRPGATRTRPAAEPAPAHAPGGSLPPRPPARYSPVSGVEASVPEGEALQCFNGYGGFSAAGDEYVIRIAQVPGGVRLPPQPWTNVVANAAAGFVASERGLGFTWVRNSREHRLTPWCNDPVSDPAGEALYLRDEDRLVFWSPTPGPAPGTGSYEVRHGFGSTTWRHESQQLAQEVLAFVPREDPVKLVRVRVRNAGTVTRNVSAFFFAEWVLGELRSSGASGIVTEACPERGMIFATRGRAAGSRVAFAAGLGPAGVTASLTADRASFLGRWGSTERPEALRYAGELNGRSGGAWDPCAAFQLTARIPPGATREWTFLLGEVEDRPAALGLWERYRTGEAVAEALRAVAEFWRSTLSGVRIETPEPALDLMVNGWLAYQTLSCRLWARSAFHQSGGAFGFRDQLQDAAALTVLLPGLTRAQILLHAAHQFSEGDVLHWWHPPGGKGLRTRFADDLLWLPYVTQAYLEATGDASVLEEPVRFLTARALADGEDEALLMPADSGTRAALYEHCCRALDRALTQGPHGLPLIGSGDWNDGMNRVGRLGRGESVWLGFFLHTILAGFTPLCAARGDSARALRYREYLERLDAALQDAGWDGAWYRRGYYDDGSPLGSAQSDECRIDALVQAWAVLSGAAPPDRADAALDAVERHLVDEAGGLIRLLTPPFDATLHDPGYIKGYLPGVRENGGQYTHAALWVVRAMAEAGRCERAGALLELLNPIRHGDSPGAVETYQVEPYVIAADVYGVAPHVGRGGWTWYTGSAGWMYRVALESILGITLRGGHTLVLRPCIPAHWPGFTVHYRLPNSATVCEITVRRGGPGAEIVSATPPATIEDRSVLVRLPGDGARHRIEVVLGSAAGSGV